jgi:hypothetical protein
MAIHLPDSEDGTLSRHCYGFGARCAGQQRTVLQRMWIMPLFCTGQPLHLRQKRRRLTAVRIGDGSRINSLLVAGHDENKDEVQDVVLSMK